jgi:hypothetical protein
LDYLGEHEDNKVKLWCVLLIGHEDLEGWLLLKQFLT